MKLKKVDNTESKPAVNKKIKTGVKKIEPEVPERKYKDLREVVDRNRPFSMMFSGVEDNNNFHVLYDMGIRNFLISYHYVQKKHLQTKEYKELGVKFFVDSGAYTFMNNLEHEETTIEEWEKYIEGYLRWVERNRDIVFACANLDIEYLVGGDQVQYWNEKYFEPFMLNTGIPVCFIHHIDTALSWEKYCQRYPYTGLSWGVDNPDGDDLKYGIDMLRTAEKYNCLVHGMAMTQTSLLTKMPFYTVDSTTWLVGLQYGEVNFWTGKKMTRLKKDKWQGAMMSQLVAKGFDEQKLYDEDTEEMIRVNVFAFIEAEEYIQDKLKSRMYWLKPEAQKRTEADLDQIEYPSVEWLDTPREERWDLEKYAQSFNISMENPDEAMNLVVDMTCFMNWDNVEYQDFISQCYTPEILKEIHDVYINRIVQSDEERIEDLKAFYKANLLGENTTLLYLGTNFDRIVKEREENEYITDEEYDLVDASEMEINNIASKYLPAPKEGSPAPEISDLDDEIFMEHDIIPVRDEKGRFLKGQKQVARPKQLNSKKFPKLACDTCFNAQKCPQYKAGYVCAYSKMFQRYDTRDMGDVIQAMQGIASYSMERLQRAMMTEILEGGLPDPNVSQLMNQSTQLLGNLQKMYEFGGQEVLRQTKILRSDGSQETTTQISNPQQGGILERIFGSMGQDTTTKEDENEILEAEVKEVKTEDDEED